MMGCLAGGTLLAEAPENEFAFAKNPLVERTGGGLGQLIPIDVLNDAAAVADEVVMPRAFRIEPSGAALDGNFTNQAGLHQVPEIVVSGGA